ncbi:MAG: phage portal protein [Alphaproteobacteria bacterium]
MASLAGLWPRYGGEGYGSGGSSRFILPGAKFNYAMEAGDLWQNSLLSLGVKWLNDRFPRPPIRVSKIQADGTYKPLPRHPLVDLWDRPNPFETRRTNEGAIGLSLVCDGNAFVQKVRDQSGQVVELWWLPHFAVNPIYPDDGSAFLSGWDVNLEGRRWTLLPDDVIHFKAGKDPRDPRRGISAVKAQLREVCCVNEESGYTASLLRNAAIPGLIITPDDDKLRPTEKDAERIKERLYDLASGDDRGSSVVLAGRYKVAPVGFSPEQLALDKLTLNARAALAASTGVALMSLGMPDPNKTYANLAEANRSSWSTIQAIQDIESEALRWNLLPEFNTDPLTHIVEFDYSNITELQESLDSLHGRVREDYKAGLVTKNEARDLIGFEPAEGGDDFQAAAPLAAEPGTAEAPQPDPVQKMALEVLLEVKSQLQLTRVGAVGHGFHDGDEPDDEGEGRL